MSNINPTPSLISGSARRLTGLVSGLDTDALVKQMILGQQNRLDKANQKKQLIEWQRESYLSVISRINSFQSTHLDVLNPNSIMRASSFKTSTASVPAGMEKFVSVSASTDSVPGALRIDKISQLAKAQTITSSHTLSRSQAVMVNMDSIEGAINSGDSFSMNISVAVGSDRRDIKIDIDYSHLSQRENSNGEQIFYLVGSNGRPLTDAQGKRIYFTENASGDRTYYTSDNGIDVNTFLTDDEIDALPANATESPLVYSDDPDEFLNSVMQKLNEELKNYFGDVGGSPAVKFGGYTQRQNSSGVPINSYELVLEVNEKVGSTVRLSGDSVVGRDQSNNLNVNNSIGSLFPDMQSSSSRVGFQINGTSFEFATTATLRDVMNEINASGAGVTVSYSATADKLIFTSKETGGGNKIVLSDTTGNFLGTVLGGSDGNFGVNEEVEDAIVTVNVGGISKELYFNSNTFTIEGIQIELLAVTSESIQITGGVDTKQATENVKEFVNSYNELIKFLDDITREAKQKGYLPLTDEQKAAMTEKQIEDWEKAAKSGILKSDQNILKILNEMRTAVITMVSSKTGTGTASFSSVGISLSDKRDGTIELDEERLQTALEKDPEALSRIFTQLSDIPRGESVTQSNRNSYADMYERVMGRKLPINPSTGERIFTQTDLNNLRYNTLGLGQRLSEIMTRAVSISPSRESRGSLTRIVGTDGRNAAIDYESTLSSQMREVTNDIKSLQQKVYDAEDKAYMRLAKLEKALATLNSQSSFLFNN